MNILVKNVTGSQCDKAVLHVESGVIVFENGDVSHITSEKGLNKQITIIKEVIAAIIEPVKTSPAQSEPPKAVKPKRK